MNPVMTLLDYRVGGANTCSNCPAPITRQSKSGLCRPCAFAKLRADPEWQRNRAACLRARHGDPAYRAAMSSAQRRWHAAHASDPAYQARQRENGKTLKATGLGNAAQPKGSAIRRRVGQILHEQRMGWCPPEYRNLYQSLRRNKRLGMAEARRRTLERAKMDGLSRLAATCLGSAIDFLRPFAPVLRRENGFLYGTALLTPEQIIERAQRRGWEAAR